MKNMNSELVGDVLGDIDEAVGVSPLVVVPGCDLDLVADDLGQAGVEDRGVRIALDVTRDDLVFRVAEDALERPLSRGLVRGVDLGDSDRA
jgi:hypothetical protein